MEKRRYGCFTTSTIYTMAVIKTGVKSVLCGIWSCLLSSECFQMINSKTGPMIQTTETDIQLSQACKRPTNKAWHHVNICKSTSDYSGMCFQEICIVDRGVKTKDVGFIFFLKTRIEGARWTWLTFLSMLRVSCLYPLIKPWDSLHIFLWDEWDREQIRCWELEPFRTIQILHHP